MFTIPEEIRQIAVIDEKPVVCPVCGSPRVVFSGMALTAGNNQIGFSSCTPGILTHSEVGTTPGIFTAAAELLCDNHHSFSYVIALDWKKGGGVSAGTISPRDGVTEEEVNEAARRMAEAEMLSAMQGGSSHAARN